MTGDAHPMWLPDEVWRPLGSRRVLLAADLDDAVVRTVHAELSNATSRWGGSLTVADERTSVDEHDVVLAVVTHAAGRGTIAARDEHPCAAPWAPAVRTALGDRMTIDAGAPLQDGMFGIGRPTGVTTVLAAPGAALLHGLRTLVRQGEVAFVGTDDLLWDLPAQPVRRLDH
ncbi:hypothetical protein IC607_01865 [Cellulomonas sp. JH27-2]|uniref:hypothetical protein n=1 Tax=Cellulomonas sp. JH27-2 TaxID=2774139 RepID=UPI001785D671|nr:hypothetical protein [Cellulomonas sp. JH27-2]MBD8057715.1 hypothetical protein [Cellulomonas sp. JH27-2]